MTDWRTAPGRIILDPRLGHRNGRNVAGGDVYDATWDIRWLGTDGQGFVYNHSPARDFALGDARFFRVFLVGGSTAMGLGVERNDQTIASRLEQALRVERPEARVVNCAVGSYTSWQQLSYLTLELMEYRPDVIVVLDGVNDFVHGIFDGGGDPLDPGFTARRPRAEAAWMPNTHTSLLKVARLMQAGLRPPSPWVLGKRWVASQPAVKRFRAWLRQVRRPAASAGAPAAQASIKPAGIDWYIRNVKSTLGVAKAHGAAVAYLFQPQLVWGTKSPTAEEQAFLDKLRGRTPHILELAPAWYRDAHERFQGVAREFHDGAGVWVEDASQWLDGEDTAYHDWIHYNEAGQRRLAERLARVVLQREAAIR